MRIENVKTYGLEESIKASGYPHKLPSELPSRYMFSEKSVKLHDQDMIRVQNLSRTPIGSGHDNFMQGIVVQANITAPRFWWPEMQRYHFIDIVSSTSTMHTLKKLVAQYEDFLKTLSPATSDVPAYLMDSDFFEENFHPHTSPVVIYESFTIMSEYMDGLKDNEIDMEILKANLPEGLYQTARITTNYRQLKTVYAQRKSHRLHEWRVFCDFIKLLPCSHLITGED